MKEILTRAPYYLLIRTNQYTGNFERELVGYTLGFVEDDQMGDLIYSPDKYCIEFYNEDIKGNPMIQETIKERFLYYETRHENWGETFYDITSHKSNQKWNCDSLAIFLEEPFCKTDILVFDYERFIIDRIKKFFKDSRIPNAEYEYGQSPDNRWTSKPYAHFMEDLKLISIELYDTRTDKVIKKYDVED